MKSKNIQILAITEVQLEKFDRWGGTSSISANIGQGMSTMATPNGRNAYKPLAEGSSPAHNADKNGPTAVFKSVSKLPTEKLTGGSLLI